MCLHFSATHFVRSMLHAVKCDRCNIPKYWWHKNGFLPSATTMLTNCKTRLKVSSVLDREPKNYSNFAKLLQFFMFCQSYSILNWIENYNMHEINLFLSASKNILCAKSIYFWLCQKIESGKSNNFSRKRKINRIIQK